MQDSVIVGIRKVSLYGFVAFIMTGPDNYASLARHLNVRDRSLITKRRGPTKWWGEGWGTSQV